MYEALLKDGLQIALLGIASLLLRRSWTLLKACRRTSIRDPKRNILLLRSFRSSVVGLALFGLALAWALDATWLLLLSLAIGGVETLESTAVLYGLTRGASLRLHT